MSALRTYDDLSLKLLLALPSTVEAKSLTDEQLERLRNISNMLDNIAYLELHRRREPCTCSASSPDDFEHTRTCPLRKP